MSLTESQWHPTTASLESLAQTPGAKMVDPEPMYRTKAAAAIYGWDRPLLTFTYPGFDCGSLAPRATNTKAITPNARPPVATAHWQLTLKGKPRPSGSLGPRVDGEDKPQGQVFDEMTRVSEVTTRLGRQVSEVTTPPNQPPSNTQTKHPKQHLPTNTPESTSHNNARNQRPMQI